VLPWKRLLNEGSMNLSATPFFSYGHSGSFDNPHNIPNFSFQGERIWLPVNCRHIFSAQEALCLRPETKSTAEMYAATKIEGWSEKIAAQRWGSRGKTFSIFISFS